MSPRSKAFHHASIIWGFRLRVPSRVTPGGGTTAMSSGHIPADVCCLRRERGECHRVKASRGLAWRKNGAQTRSARRQARVLIVKIQTRACARRTGSAQPFLRMPGLAMPLPCGIFLFSRRRPATSLVYDRLTIACWFQPPGVNSRRHLSLNPQMMDGGGMLSILATSPSGVKLGTEPGALASSKKAAR